MGWKRENGKWVETLNMKGVQIDIDAILKKYECRMQSISDTVEISQIALFCQQNPNHYRNVVLMDMINHMWTYAAMYPQPMTKMDYSAYLGRKEGNEVRDEVLNKYLEKINLERIRNKNKKDL